MISAIGIPSAATRTVQDAANALPSMRGTLLGWFRPLTLIQIVKTVVDFETREVRREISCGGVIQPCGSEELKIKPEGQRTWNWQMLHTTPDVMLDNDEEFTIKGTRYRVMEQTDYSDYGYITYELVQDYRPNPQTSDGN